jgi:hypothetical protein
VCGEEALVNEEIVDVTIGRLKFDGEYQGGMPTLGCPGCEGKTLEVCGAGRLGRPQGACLTRFAVREAMKHFTRGFLKDGIQ